MDTLWLLQYLSNFTEKLFKIPWLDVSGQLHTKHSPLIPFLRSYWIFWYWGRFPVQKHSRGSAGPIYSIPHSWWGLIIINKTRFQVANPYKIVRAFFQSPALIENPDQSFSAILWKVTANYSMYKSCCSDCSGITNLTCSAEKIE